MGKVVKVLLFISFLNIWTTSTILYASDHIRPSFSYPALDLNKENHKSLYQAQLFITQSLPDKGIPILLELLKQNQLNSDFETFSKIYLVEAYRQKHEFVKGKELLKELLLESNLSSYNRSLAYNRLAALYHEEKEDFKISRLDSVVKYSNLSLEISQKDNFKELIASSLNELGQYYHKTVHNDTIAIDYFNQALDSFIQMKMYQNAFYAAFNLSKAYMTMQQPKKALQSLDRVKNLLKPIDNKNLFMYYHEKKGKIYNSIGNYQKAFFHIEKAYAYEKDFYNYKIDTEISEMIAKYDLQIKEQKIQKEQRKNQFIIVFSVFLLLSLLMGLYMLYLKKRIIQTEYQNLKIKLESQNKELLSASNNIMGINKLLNEIKLLIVNEDTKEAIKLINKNVKTEQNWQTFYHKFDQVYPDFRERLVRQYPKLTKNDLQLATLILMNLKTNDMADILCISPASVSKRRNRFRNKLHLESNTDLYTFILGAYQKSPNLTTEDI